MMMMVVGVVILFLVSLLFLRDEQDFIFRKRILLICVFVGEVKHVPCSALSLLTDHDDDYIVAHVRYDHR